jgi:mycothiol synthase
MRPAKVSLRALDPARDWPAAAALIATTNLHDGTAWIPTAEILAHEWSPNPTFDPSVDIRVVEADDGSLIGLVSVDWRERDERLISHHSEIWVRPNARRRGIGTALLEWSEAYSRERARAGLAGRLDLPHVMGGWGEVSIAGHAALAASHGYHVYRHGYEMRRDLVDPIGPHLLPAGLEVRPVEPSHYRRIWDADTEAFRDHPEPALRTDEDFESWFSTPYLDTSLYQVAWDGDEVAGSVLTSIQPEENERLGVRRAWLDHVSVRRAYRGRGLAASLIASTLEILRSRGIDEAALGVDAQNPTGALRLYQRLGFRKVREAAGYRKVLEL